MSSQQLCHHRSCSNRAQLKVPSTKPPHCGRPRLLPSPFILSSRCCSQRAARLAATQCSSSPDGPQRVSDQGPQRVSDQSPADEILPPLPSSRMLLAVGSIGLAVVAFVASRSLLGRPALDELKLQSMPLHSALANGRPTVLEFYADWCEVCGELAPTALQIKQAYNDRVNFVMLNIENTKWAPEVAEYGVQGIPHFVFLDKSGVAQAAVVGRLPREVLEGDVKALAQSTALPFRGMKRQTSSMSKFPSSGQPQVAPRDHA